MGLISLSIIRCSCELLTSCPPPPPSKKCRIFGPGNKAACFSEGRHASLGRGSASLDFVPLVAGGSLASKTGELHDSAYRILEGILSELRIPIEKPYGPFQLWRDAQIDEGNDACL